MVTETRAEIVFTRIGEPSISLQSTATGNREKFQEILLFCHFAADHLTKIEKHFSYVSTLIALLLINTSGNLSGLAKSRVAGAHGLPPAGRWHPRRRIAAQLSSSTSGKVAFHSSHKGWHWSQWNRACHSANGTLMLMKYLARQRMEDTPYLNALARAARAVGAGYIQRHLSGDSGNDVPTIMALKAAGAFALEDLPTGSSVRRNDSRGHRGSL
jgi:hypothetical protein